jgi:choline dehydrogenase-like flavoprotein
MKPLPKEVDAIVVGTGPGGATVARELTRNHQRVLMLEWGDDAPLTGGTLQGVKSLLVPGRSLLLTPQLLGLVRGITTGGSSVLNYATAFPVPFDMLASYGVDIRREVKALREELPVAPLKDEMVGPMSRRIMESARDLGYDWQKLDKLMYQDRWTPGTPFGHYGDPYEVKWSARMFAHEAIARGARLVNGARVTRVLFDGRCAVGVEFVRKGEKTRAFAPRIILSAGGIGTPVILRASGIEGAGFDFFFDPLIGVRGTVRDIDVPTSEIPMSAGVHLADEGYMMTDMAHPYFTTALFAAGALRFDQMGARRRTLQIMVKAKDELGGRLTDRGGVRKTLGKTEKRKLQRGYERARAILKRAGARDIFRTHYLAAHPGGTVKIADLVDSNLMTAYDNLYVCDCSVIPQAWGLPPSMTLIALGKRLAMHLVRKSA